MTKAPAPLPPAANAPATNVTRALALLMAVSLCVGCESRPVPPRAADPPKNEISSGELFHRKMECQKYWDKLRDQAEQDQLAVEAIYRVFYSPRRNSCLVAKYTLYPPPAKGKRTTTNEKLEIDDILSREELWSNWCEDAPKYWAVEVELDSQAKNFE